MSSLSLFALSYQEPANFPVWERALITLLIAAAVILFWVRFRKVWRQITSAKPDVSFSLQPLGARIRDFLVEVILQAKVIRERPLPGIAHALVFWGFCAFALVTINHFATGFGVSFLSEDALYLWVAAVFATLVIGGILGLFIRRFVVRPVWLGEHLSGGSAIVAFLILTLMLTYLAAFVVTGDATIKAVWWTHTIALLVFLPLIPHTKHLHLMLSPATVFLSHGSFSSIPPLVGDEDFGMVNGKDVTTLVALQAYTCVECGRCTEHCPAANTGKELNPKEIVLGLRRYLNEFGTGSEEPLLGKYNSQTAVFQCTTCGSCEYQCPVGIEHLPMIVGLRRGSVNTGAWEDDYGTKLFLNLERNGNVLGMNAAERDKFILKQQFPIFDGSQEFCLWLGCMGAYDPAGREIISALAGIMTHLGVTFGVLRRERCTGDSARRLGNDLVFQQLAEQNLDALGKVNAKRLISVCPHCVRTISTDWREFGTPPHIEHHTEFLARHRDQLAAGRNSRTIVYHDPCYLGRYRGTYEEPRAVLSRFGSLQEPDRTGTRSFCCGAGGGLALLGEETGDRVSRVRASQLASTGAEIIGAACPFCNTMFRDAVKAMPNGGPQVLDVAQIAAMSLPGTKSGESTGVPA